LRLLPLSCGFETNASFSKAVKNRFGRSPRAYENLKVTYAQIMDWVVSEGVGLRDAPLFEKYLNRDPRRTKPENLSTEIYVPIV